MIFWWSATVNNFLFYGLNIHSVPWLLALCFAVACFAFLFEFLRLLQSRQRQKELIIRAKQIQTICPMKEDSSLLSRHNTTVRPVDLSVRNRATLYACDVSLWFLLHNLGYFIMLMVMVYNVWIFISVVIGGGFGYFVFGQSLMKLNAENCQVVRNTYCMANCAKPDSVQNGESTPAMMASTSTVSCHSNTEVQVSVHNCLNSSDNEC